MQERPEVPDDVLGPLRAICLALPDAPPELDVLRNAGDPFFAPPWRRDEVGLVLGPDPDWAEIAELFT